EPGRQGDPGASDPARPQPGTRRVRQPQRPAAAYQSGRVRAMPQISLDLTDAAELGQLLEFLNDWLGADRPVLEGSLGRFVGRAGYDLEQLHADLHRFAFLIGDTDG